MTCIARSLAALAAFLLSLPILTSCYSLQQSFHKFHLPCKRYDVDRGAVELTDSGKYSFVPGGTGAAASFSVTPELHLSLKYVERLHIPPAGWNYFWARRFAGGVAWGAYVDSKQTISNFGQLTVNTNGSYRDHEQVFAAGYLEGYLTAPQIYENFQNLLNYFTKTMNVSLPEPMKWIEKQDRWLHAECAHRSEFMTHRTSDRKERSWASVCLLVEQFDGMTEGYQARRKQANAEGMGEMAYSDFLFMHSNADLYDVIDMLDPSQGPTWSVQSGASPAGTGAGTWRAQRHAAFAEQAQRDPEMAAAKLFADVALSGRCSALVKLAADLSDMWLGHSTWDTYTAALRIFKHYNFSLGGLQPAAGRTSFSSYPGELFSDDDFYLMSSKLVLLQTTNKIFNDELFEELHPHTFLSWQRVRTANWLATSGEEWAEYLKLKNSGTYNNQYMVVDLGRFRKGVEAQAGLLWVVEQAPGMVVGADMTSILFMGYWPSFNVPFFPEIYNHSGYPDFISRIEKYGQHFDKTTHWLSYQQSPRSKIFRRDQGAVTDLEGMKGLMRQNNWKSDPFSEGHPICAVCGRGDLDPKAPEARGCYDTKVTSYTMALKMEAEAVNGPTTSGGHLPPFDWTRQFSNLTHRGHPDVFNFRFERMSAAAVEAAAAAAAAAESSAVGVAGAWASSLGLWEAPACHELEAY